jgi:hypothetical protein
VDRKSESLAKKERTHLHVLQAIEALAPTLTFFFSLFSSSSAAALFADTFIFFPSFVAFLLPFKSGLFAAGAGISPSPSPFEFVFGAAEAPAAGVPAVEEEGVPVEVEGEAPSPAARGVFERRGASRMPLFRVD